MGDYGGRWRRDGEYILGEDGKPVSCAPRVRDRVVADHNALLGVPNPAGVAKLVELAERIVIDAETHDATDWGPAAEVALGACGLEA